MSPFLMGLIGGAGQGLQTLNKQNYDEQVRADEEATRGRLMQQQSDLRIKEEQTVMGLKEAAAQRAIASKRATDQSDAASVQNTATNTATTRDVGNIEKARGLINVDPAQREPISAEDVQNIRGMVSPEMAKTQYGLEAPTRAQGQADLADAALAAGRPDMEKGFRDQQQVELTNIRDTNRDKHQTEQDAIKNRQVDSQIAFNESRASIQDRLAAVQESRLSRMESRQTTQMDKAELTATRQSLTSVLTDIGKQQDRLEGLMATAMDPEQKAVYSKQMERLTPMRELARTRLNELAGIEAPKDAPKPVATYDNVAAYAKTANIPFEKALEIAGKTYDVSAVKSPDKPVAKADAPKPGLIAADKPARDFYTDGTPKRAKEPTASQADIAEAQQTVGVLQARYNTTPIGDGKNITGPASAARMQIAGALADAKDRLQKLLDQGK